MEATVDRLIFFAVGVAIGYALHIIVMELRTLRHDVHDVKEEVDEVLKIERKHDEGGFLSNPVAFNISFALLMLFVFYAAYSSFQNGRHLKENVTNDFIRVCQSAQEIRDVQRKTVDAVYGLAVSVVNRDKNDPKRSPIETARTNIFITKANDFRQSSYNDIKPSKACLPYVTDANVEPPTPPQPLLK